MTFPDRDLISENIDRISPDVVYFTEVDDIGAVDFQEGLTVKFLFHVL